MDQKVITGIQVGAIQDKVGWVLQYEGGTQESFSLHQGVARQFLQGLQEVLLTLVPPVAPLQGTQDGVWTGEYAAVHLHGPSPTEDS